MAERSLGASGAVVFLLVTAICFAVLAVAANGVTETYRYFGLVSLAKKADREGSVPEEALTSAVRNLPQIMQDHVCRADIIRAGTRLLLLDVDRTTQGLESGQLRSALVFPETFLRYALSCRPQDGDIWLRLAMVRSMRYDLSSEIAEMVHMSQMLAPGDVNVIEGRLSLWASLSDRTQSLLKDSYAADVAVVCNQRVARLIKNYGLKCAPR